MMKERVSKEWGPQNTKNTRPGVVGGVLSFSVLGNDSRRTKGECIVGQRGFSDSSVRATGKMSVVAKLLEKAEKAPGLHYRNPSVPHACSIPGGLSIGTKIYIYGMVPPDSTKFAVNLQRGADPELADLHLNLVARLGPVPVVVRNSRLHGQWAAEEQLPGSFPFPLELRPFLLVITTYVDTYEIEINGSSNFSLKVRDGLPISAVTHLAIEAGLAVRAIHVPVESMPRNLRLNIGVGARVGDMFFLKAEPTPEAKSFIVNLQSGPGKFDDVNFHLNPRLADGRVVRNSRTDDEWGKEESTKEMPFSPETPFELVVGVSSLGFDTRLDGNDWGRFDHRTQDIAATTTLFLEGDLQPTDVAVHRSQVIPLAVNGNSVKSRGVRLQLFFPELPLASPVTGGFEKGCLLLLSGITSAKESSAKFELCVQCGEGPDNDVALRYESRWQDGDPSARLNSREDGNWGAETKVSYGGPVPGRPFDLLVARVEEGFRCFLDSDAHADFPYRIEDPLPNYVSLSGDLQVYRLLLL